MKTALCLLFAAAMAVPALNSPLAEDIAPMALNSLSAAPAKVATAPVLDQNGTVIGKVRAIVTDQDGRPAAMSYVASSDNRIRVIGAPAVSYDAQKNLMIADVSKTRLGEQVALN